MTLPTDQHFDNSMVLYGESGHANHDRRYVSSQIKSTEELLDNATRNLSMNPYLSFEMGNYNYFFEYGHARVTLG